MEDQIVNRVSNSSLERLDLEDWYDLRPRKVFDLKPFLYQELVLKELDFRAALKALDWAQFKETHVAICCSTDAIIPTWAFMLVAQYLAPVATTVTFGSLEQLDDFLFDRWITALDPEPYRDAKLIVKGCSKYPVPVSAYVAITAKLAPVVQSLMFGEPCSNVPLYKRKKDSLTSAIHM